MTDHSRVGYPFAAIVGQESFKQALLLAAVDPRLGGVLVTGDKGSGKTTTVRALADLFRGAEEFPFVNLPVGATEDRVLGSADLELLINEKRLSIRKGLLAEAHTGILYIDEVNLLNDYLVDVLLDAAASGGYRLERDGLSVWQDSRFILVGTMNPEEGQLRPQLLDRFGFCVPIRASTDAVERAEITRRRLAFDGDALGFCRQYAEAGASIRRSVLDARVLLPAVIIPDECYAVVAALCLERGAEGMRADILILTAARALAALEGRNVVGVEDIRVVAPLVLAHRGKQEDGRLRGEGGWQGDGSPRGDGGGRGAGSPGTEKSDVHNGGTGSSPLQQYLMKAVATSRGLALPMEKKTKSGSGHVAADVKEERVDWFATVRHYLVYGRCRIVKESLRRETLKLVLLVDSSSSMAMARQVGRVKGMLETLLQTTRFRKVLVAVIALLQGGARLVTGFTDDRGLVLRRLALLPTGGRTNLVAGLEEVKRLVRRGEPAQLYLFTDGRINMGKDPVRFFRRQLHHLRATTWVLDTETGYPRLGMAPRLAKALQVKYRSI